MGQIPQNSIVVFYLILWGEKSLEITLSTLRVYTLHEFVSFSRYVIFILSYRCS